MSEEKKLLKTPIYNQGYNAGVRKERKNLDLYNKGYSEGVRETKKEILGIVKDYLSEEEFETLKNEVNNNAKVS